MGDVLAGQREAINRGELKVLRFAGDRPCPVQKGERFRLRSCSIQIERIQRYLKGGRSEWIVGFVRLEDERGFYLGKTVLSEVRSLQHGERWDYREEHGYTTGRDVFDAGVCVPPDHQRNLSENVRALNEIRRRHHRARTPAAAGRWQVA